ncbi:hypothetical protein SXYLSMQ121_0571 [Staphylococcus xylosus]|nr:hypothetical protein SXYLSMQ121_0571 [Staphylococcus xylosus]
MLPKGLKDSTNILTHFHFLFLFDIEEPNIVIFFTIKL